MGTLGKVSQIILEKPNIFHSRYRQENTLLLIAILNYNTQTFIPIIPELS